MKKKPKTGPVKNKTEEEKQADEGRQNSYASPVCYAFSPDLRKEYKEDGAPNERKEEIKPIKP